MRPESPPLVVLHSLVLGAHPGSTEVAKAEAGPPAQFKSSSKCQSELFTHRCLLICCMMRRDRSGIAQLDCAALDQAWLSRLGSDDVILVDTSVTAA